MKHTFFNRIWSALLVLCMVFGGWSATVLHAGAGDTPIIPMDPSHKHAFVETVTEEPTCTEVGRAQYTCSCGKSFTLQVQALGHNFRADEPYCLNGCGQMDLNCQSEHHHRYTQELTPPACDEAGYTTHTCFLCKNTYTDTTVEALGHAWDEGVQKKAPSCTQPGEKQYVCLRDATHSKTVEIAPIGHDYNNEIKKPTASALGYTIHSCKRCEQVDIDTYTPATGKPTLKCKQRAAQSQTLSWNNIKTATGYQLQITTKDGKKWEKTVTLKAGTTSYTFKGLEAGKPYRFRVRFYIKAADGNNYFAPWSATLRSPTLPKGTSVSKVTGAKKAFTAQWKQNKEITGYQLQYSLKSDFSTAKTVTIKSNKTIKTTVNKLNANKVYYVRIRTYKSIEKANYYASWSKAAKVKTK